MHPNCHVIILCVTFAENQWLDMKENSPHTCDKYLLLLVKIFEQLTQGVAFSKDVHIGSYVKDILSLLVKVRKEKCFTEEI